MNRMELLNLELSAQKFKYFKECIEGQDQRSSMLRGAANVEECVSSIREDLRYFNSQRYLTMHSRGKGHRYLMLVSSRESFQCFLELMNAVLDRDFDLPDRYEENLK